MIIYNRYIYVRIYQDSHDKLVFYTGITEDMSRRQEQHDLGLCRTTNRYNKSYKLKEIKYKGYDEVTLVMLRELERKFKKLELKHKIEMTDYWEVWRVGVSPPVG